MCPPGFRTQLHVTTSLSTGGGPVSACSCLRGVSRWFTPSACGPGHPELSKSYMDMASKSLTFTFTFTLCISCIHYMRRKHAQFAYNACMIAWMYPHARSHKGGCSASGCRQAFCYHSAVPFSTVPSYTFSTECYNYSIQHRNPLRTLCLTRCIWSYDHKRISRSNITQHPGGHRPQRPCV